MTPIKVEVAIETVDDAIVAVQGGADRLELSSALALGGLTPSLGTYLEVRSTTSLPIVVMIRPRAGGFVYSTREYQTMLRDVEAFLPHRPDAFVFGILNRDGTTDLQRNRELLTRCQPVPCVFHRAFDLCPDLFEAARSLIDIGFCRVLTSGGAETASQGVAELAQLQAQSEDRLGILPGGGVRASNVLELVRRTGCREVHGSFSSRDAEGQLRTCAEQVRSCRDELARS